MFVAGPVQLVNRSDIFEQRTTGRGATVGQYVKDWDDRLRPFYANLPTARGDRCLVVTIAPGARHRVWLVAPSATVEPEEQTFVDEVQATIRIPAGFLEPIMFAATYWLGPEGASPPFHEVDVGGTRRHIRHPVQLPAELSILGERLGKTPFTVEELLAVIWDEPVVTWGEALPDRLGEQLPEGLPVPVAIGRFFLDLWERHPDPSKGTRYRYSDGSPTQVSVFLYPVGDDVKGASNPDGWVVLEGGKFADELIDARQNGLLCDELQITCMKAEPLVHGRGAIFCHEAGATVWHNAGVRVERQFLFLLHGSFVKVLTAELDRTTPEAPIPEFTRLLVAALLDRRA